MTSIVSGKLIDTKVIVKIYPGLHKGNINKVNAIIVHQTDSDTAQQTFNKYNAKSTTGAHFLIDKKGNNCMWSIDVGGLANIQCGGKEYITYCKNCENFMLDQIP